MSYSLHRSSFVAGGREIGMSYVVRSSLYSLMYRYIYMRCCDSWASGKFVACSPSSISHRNRVSVHRWTITPVAGSTVGTGTPPLTSCLLPLWPWTVHHCLLRFPAPVPTCLTLFAAPSASTFDFHSSSFCSSSCFLLLTLRHPFISVNLGFKLGFISNR